MTNRVYKSSDDLCWEFHDLVSRILRIDSTGGGTASRSACRSAGTRSAGGGCDDGDRAGGTGATTATGRMGCLSHFFVHQTWSSI